VNTIITTTKTKTDLRTRMQEDFERYAPTGTDALREARENDRQTTQTLVQAGGVPSRYVRGGGGHSKPDDIDVLQYRYRLAHPDEYPPYAPTHPDDSVVDEFFYSTDPFTGVESVVSAPEKVAEEWAFLPQPGGGCIRGRKL
jgi:hypothetical protein